MGRNRIHFGNAEVDVVTKHEVLARAGEFLARASERPRVIVAVNAQLVHLVRMQPRFAACLERADLSLADGMSLVFASRLLGKPLPERIAGVDLTEDLWALLNEQNGSIYLLGGQPGAAEETVRRLGARYPNVRAAVVDCPPRGFEKDEQASRAVLERIQAARPDLLLVGLGAPKQEYWIEDHISALPCKLVVGVGGTFDILSGLVRRAPVWMQRTGLEWFFRLCIEPRRLWRRYLVGNSYFVWLVATQFVERRLSPKRRSVAGEAQ
jgi:N-acetylglucosaminyldiphosphoundecaprenol N-acetyl-beta-D-mannosaminyltransferase